MKKLLKAIPHILTLFNLFCGSIACISLIEGNYAWVFWCLLGSAIADFLDGFAARAFNVSGPFGRELDSLADMVSFGLCPGLMAYVMLSANQVEGSYWVFVSLIIPVMSAVRLATFNIEQSDVKHFIGLNTPTNCVFWLGLFMAWQHDSLGSKALLSEAYIILPLLAIFSYLLVSQISMYSNKIDLRNTKNWPVGLVLVAAIILPWFMAWLSMAIVVILYVVASLFWTPDKTNNIVNKA